MIKSKVIQLPDKHKNILMDYWCSIPNTSNDFWSITILPTITIMHTDGTQSLLLTFLFWHVEFHFDLYRYIGTESLIRIFRDKQ
jgi:hypothetical protein